MSTTHATHLERWLGRDNVEQLSRSMRGWYGPPIHVRGVPGNIVVGGDGDFRGKIRAGFEMSALDRAEDLLRRFRRASRCVALSSKLHAGFSSLSDLLAEASGGKRQQIHFNKVGTTGVVGATNSLFRVGAQPAAGNAAAAAPGGTQFDKSTTGALPLVNAAGGDTTHFVGAAPLATLQNQLLLYDRLFGVLKAMNSTSTEAVTGTLTRYTNTTAGQPDSAVGNFLFIETGTALAATGHNWTVCTYTDESGNTGATLPSVTGNSGNIINRLDQPTGQFFCPLATGDSGILALTQMQCSAAVATGAIDFVIGHPIAWLPCPIANVVCPVDGINSNFDGLPRVFDNACLAFLEVMKPATGATTYTGSLTLVQG